MKKQIKFKNRHSITGLTAGQVYEALNDASENGELTPEQLLNYSKPKTAILHNQFEWNDKKAGYKYRIIQGRNIIQSIEIIHDNNAPVRAYESVEVINIDTEKPKKVYRKIEDIMSNEEERDYLLGRAINDALIFKRRYANLQELAKVFSAFDEFLKEAKVN